MNSLKIAIISMLFFSIAHLALADTKSEPNLLNPHLSWAENGIPETGPFGQDLFDIAAERRVIELYDMSIEPRPLSEIDEKLLLRIARRDPEPVVRQMAIALLDRPPSQSKAELRKKIAAENFDPEIYLLPEEIKIAAEFADYDLDETIQARAKRAYELQCDYPSVGYKRADNAILKRNKLEKLIRRTLTLEQIDALIGIATTDEDEQVRKVARKKVKPIKKNKNMKLRLGTRANAKQTSILRRFCETLMLKR